MQRLGTNQKSNIRASAPWMAPFAVLIFANLASAQFATNDVRTFDDANLYSVQFVDVNEGWAVGDLGTVWYTSDGGKSWERQWTGTRATLRSISMIDHRIGHIAARVSVPYANCSTGIVLSTKNGGIKWENGGTNSSQAVRPILPGLISIQFPAGVLNEDAAIAVGETTDLFPFGLCYTSAGPSKWDYWQANRVKLKTFRPNPWTASRFSSIEKGMLGTADGRLFTFENQALNQANTPLGLRNAIRDFAGNEKSSWAVGDQACLLSSNDDGQTWTKTELPVSPDIAKIWNFQAISIVGKDIWIAGRPGSVIAHSPDLGKTWKFQRTPTAMPINDLCFVDAQNGWAVGAMGQILGTKDGGETWTVQQTGAKRAAALCIQFKASQTPLATIARLSGEEGFQSVVIELASPDARENPSKCISETLAFADAFRAAGGTLSETLYRFPLSTEEMEESMQRLLKRWDTMHEGKAVREIERDLVLAMRMYQPAVVLSENTDAKEFGMQGMTLAGMAARRAFQTAADTNSFPEQLEFFGLKPSAAEKVYGRTKQTGNVNVTLPSNEIGSHIATTYAEYAEIAAASFDSDFHPVPASDNYVLLKSKSEDASSHTSLMQGTEKLISQDCQRRLEQVDTAALASANKLQLIHKELSEKSSQLQDSGPIRELVSSYEASLSGVDELRKGQLYFALAREAFHSSRYKGARNFNMELIRRHPFHPMTLAAYRWVIAYHTSAEMLMFARRDQATNANRAKTNNGAAEKELSTDADLSTDESSLQRALDFGDGLKRLSVEAWSDPRVQLCFISIQRRLVDMNKVVAISKEVLNSGSALIWADLIDNELNVFGKADRPNRQASIASFNDPRYLEYEESLVKDKKESADTRRPTYYLAQPLPVIDGDLSDLFWQKCGKKELVTRIENMNHFQTDVMMRYNDKSLYIAARCKYPSAEFKAKPADPILRDHDLSSSDRLEVILDSDRDYTTYFRIVFSQAGQISDDCWGNASWNPKIVRAIQQQDDGWTLEAAIPISELSSSFINGGDYWGINIHRLVPNQGTAALSLPATRDGRMEGMTTVRFQQRSKDVDDYLQKAKHPQRAN